ncbi:MAG TPA: hypothetical protein VFM53_10785 [Anaeromyxobacteraceae bacterium]|nr:hypothetical protein [Anaeromyxobacteraceae bacterium]
MTDANGGPSGRKPLAVYAVLDRKDGGRPFWLKIGAAFTNRDGSLTAVLDAVPTGTNRLQIREQRAAEEGRPGGNGAARAEEEARS